MPRIAGAAVVIALSIAAAPGRAQAPAPPAGAAQTETGAPAGATVSCPFEGKLARTVISNPRDIQRSCNASCVWYYGGSNVPFRGAGGALLAAGESKTVWNATAPMKIDTAVASGITCDK